MYVHDRNKHFNYWLNEQTNNYEKNAEYYKNAWNILQFMRVNQQFDPSPNYKGFPEEEENKRKEESIKPNAQ